MLTSLRQTSRLLAGQTQGIQNAATLATRMFSSQAGALHGLLAQQQLFSLGSLPGMQQAAAAPPLAPAAPAAVPALLGHFLTPAAAQVLLNLQQQQPAPAILPELPDLVGGLQGGPGQDTLLYRRAARQNSARLARGRGCFGLAWLHGANATTTVATHTLRLQDVDPP